jgi:hypothetical protein
MMAMTTINSMRVKDIRDRLDIVLL